MILRLSSTRLGEALSKTVGEYERTVLPQFTWFLAYAVCDVRTP